jgi:hypothetical protein
VVGSICAILLSFVIGYSVRKGRHENLGLCR